jgi:hypothetical protein
VEDEWKHLTQVVTLCAKGSSTPRKAERPLTAMIDCKRDRETGSKDPRRFEKECNGRDRITTKGETERGGGRGGERRVVGVELGRRR